MRVEVDACECQAQDNRVRSVEAQLEPSGDFHQDILVPCADAKLRAASMRAATGEACAISIKCS